MSHKYPKVMAKLFVLSFLATSLGIVLALMMAVFVPVYVDLGTDGESFPRKDVYSREELDRADVVFQEKLERYKQKNKNKTFSDHAREMKDRVIWMTWIPWFFLPLAISLKRYSAIPSFIILPLLLVFTGLTSPLEIVTFSLSLLVGIYLTKKSRS